MTIAQFEFLSEETHSQNKVTFGLEYKTKQMAPCNNVLIRLIASLATAHSYCA